MSLSKLIQQAPESTKPYGDFLREHGWIQQYAKFMLTHPVCMDLESSWIDSADLSACCALLTALLWEDYFDNGAFRKRLKSGTVKRILERMEHLQDDKDASFFPEPQNISTIRDLYAEKCRQLPARNGIYQVEAPPNMEIRFLPQTIAKEKRLYPAEELQRKWQNGDHRILYIGKAQRKKGGLQKRVWEYLRYGYDGGRNHRGGRGIWQIKDCQELYIRWTVLAQANEVEHQLLKYYQNHYNTYPAANRMG